MEFTLLENLIHKHAVSSDTREVREFILLVLKDNNIPAELDDFGSIIFGNKSAEVMFVAHMDEIGFQVTGIYEDGTLSILPIGDLRPIKIDHANVYIQGSKGKVKGGVFNCGALRPDCIEDFNKLFVDIGTKSKSETLEQGVKPGQTGTFQKTFFQQGEKIFATSLDNKAAIYTVLEMVREDITMLDKFLFAFHMDEEMQNHSGDCLACTFKPRFTVVLDIMPSHQCKMDEVAHVTSGKGVVVPYRGGRHILQESVRDKIENLEINRVFIPSEIIGSLESQNFENNGRTRSLGIYLPVYGYHGSTYSAFTSDFRDFRDKINLIGNTLLN